MQWERFVLRPRLSVQPVHQVFFARFSEQTQSMARAALRLLQIGTRTDHVTQKVSLRFKLKTLNRMKVT